MMKAAMNLNAILENDLALAPARSETKKRTQAKHWTDADFGAYLVAPQMLRMLADDTGALELSWMGGYENGEKKVSFFDRIYARLMRVKGERDRRRVMHTVMEEAFEDARAERARREARTGKKAA